MNKKNRELVALAQRLFLCVFTYSTLRRTRTGKRAKRDNERVKSAILPAAAAEGRHVQTDAYILTYSIYYNICMHK